MRTFRITQRMVSKLNLGIKKVLTFCVIFSLTIILLYSGPLLKDKDEMILNHPAEPIPFKKEIYLRDRKLKMPTQINIDEMINNLPVIDRNNFKKCTQRYKNRGMISWKRICTPYMRFRPANKSNDVTALIGFPGSGNTWMRQIIEEATGIYTGSVYCDKVLKGAGFLGENIKSTSVLAIKTHEIHSRLMMNSQREYDSALFLIRNPHDAIIAETNRRWTNNHTDIAKMDEFMNYDKWSKLVSELAKIWQTTVKTWLKHDIPLLVVRYEDLKSDLLNQMKRILAFLKVPYTEEQLDCVLNANQNTFKRNYIIDDEKKYDYYYYTIELRNIIQTAMNNVKPLLSEFGVSYE